MTIIMGAAVTAVTAHAVLSLDGAVAELHLSVIDVAMVSSMEQRPVTIIMGAAVTAVTAPVVLKQDGHALVVRRFVRCVETVSSMELRLAMIEM